MTTVLGLDSGGTKTLAVIADRSGNILRHWTGPGFDPMTGDRSKCRDGGQGPGCSRFFSLCDSALVPFHS